MGGLALATALSSYFNAFMLYRGLRQKGVYRPSPGWGRFSIRLLIANVSLVGVALLLAGHSQQWLRWTAWDRITQMTVVVLAGVSVYFLILVLVGLRPRHLRGAQF